MNAVWRGVGAGRKHMPTQEELGKKDRASNWWLGQGRFRHDGRWSTHASQLQTQQSLHGNPPLQKEPPVVVAGAIRIHFDGTQNNGWLSASGEGSTALWSMEVE